MRRPRLILAFASFVLIGIAAGASGVIIPSQLSDYGVDKTTFGLTFFTFSAGYVLSGLSNGFLVRRLGVRGQLSLGAAVYLATAFAVGLHPTFPLLIAASVVSGFGTGILDAGFNAYVTSLPGHTGLLNYLHAFFGVGALIGPPLTVALLDRHWPWQDVYLILAACTAPLLIGCVTLLPGRDTERSTADPVAATDPASADPVAATDPAADPVASAALAAADPVPVVPGPPGETAAPPPERISIAAALRRREVWLGGAFLCLYVGVEVSVGNWGFSLLTQVRDQPERLAGWVVAGYWLGLTLGRFLLNSAASRAGLGVVAMMYCCLVGIAAAILLAWWGPGAGLAILGFGLIGFFLGPLFPTTIAVLPRMTPARLVPTAIGLLVGASVVGGSVFPWLAGALAQGLGLESLLPYTLALSVLLFAVWARISRRMRGTESGTGQRIR